MESVDANHLDEQSALLAKQWEQTGQLDKAVTYLQRAGEYAVTQSLHDLLCYPSLRHYGCRIARD